MSLSFFQKYKYRTFKKGGIHPPENKLSARKPIVLLHPPTTAVIPIAQSLGIPSSPIVAKGDSVKVGTLIARANGFVSANIHSSVSGVVSKIDEVTDISGYRRPAIFIDVDGDEWESGIDRTDTLVTDIQYSPEDIISKIGQMGIVGLGGATFPTHVKLTPPNGATIEVLLVNAVECEPYLTADHQLMLEKADEILVGIQLLMKALKINKAFIAIENNKADAIRLFREKVKDSSGIEVVALQTQYPQGSEKQLIEAVLNRRVKSGELPASVGATVQNVATVFAVYEAVQKNKPLVERVVTISGSSVLRPSNKLVRIGTPIRQLIEAVGEMPGNTGKIIAGGPMMGKAVVNADVPVVKGCSGILLLTNDEAQRVKMKPCIRCSKCVQACPMELEPYLLGKAGELQLWEMAVKERVMDCIECGTCSYVCPANRPLVDFIRLGKSKAGALLRAQK
ncbi:electron transport complex subunit RsxC [Parabacteroides sp. FAFU027]|uniref:electron transport complex subunit RsxC n=1 Tax=Parabacteroides sp. FAFU027 TaxID=2922715 RepID=UPI001FAF4784|nr:electron transport complex subunit RsxC [Parabacteroides sp. FAFU027]